MTVTTKKCGKCKEVKQASEFSLSRKKKSGLSSYCRTCASAYYQENRDRLYPMIKARGKIARQSVKDFVLEYKSSHPCEKCGEADPAALDFHHSDGKKEFTVGRALVLGRTLRRVKEEIEKCRVLCASCHRKFHAGRFQLASKAR
jgi:protein-arginine kinase activator protein McsA